MSTPPPVDAVDDLILPLDEESVDDPVLDLSRLFGNDRPVEVELGFGKGRFLLDAAARHPEVNYLGVEWAGKYLRLTLERARRRGLSNLRFVHGDAREFVEFFLPSASVRALHIYFPDPWPKKKHHKRRLLSGSFLAEAARILEPGGRLWLATDHDGYHDAIQEDLLSCHGQLRPVDAPWEGARTNYENKFLQGGRPIHRQVLQRQ